MSRGPRSLAAVGLALLLLAGPAAAQDGAGAPAAAEPSPTRARDGGPGSRVWIALGAGAALTALSFGLAERADDSYERYGSALDPAAIEDEYDRAVRYDRLATASLLAGQLSLAAGLYWWLVHRPSRDAAGQTGGLSETPPAPTAAAEPALRWSVRRGELRLGVALAF